MNGSDLERFLEIKDPTTLSVKDWRRYVLITQQDIQRFLQEQAPSIDSRLSKLENIVGTNSWVVRGLAVACATAIMLELFHF